MPLSPRALALASRAELDAPAAPRDARYSRNLRAIMLATGLALLAAPRPARAGDRDACIDASEKGQVLRDEGKLENARQKFLFCSREVCPPLVRTDCANWLANVDARMPSIVVTAKGPDGHDTADVSLTVDGRLIQSRLDGKAVPLDPGEHVIRYERAGNAPITDKVLIREGEQRRALIVRFPGSNGTAKDTAKEPPPGGIAAPAPRVPVATWVLGGLGVAAGGVVVYFGSSALRDFNQLQTLCDTGDCDLKLAEKTQRERLVTNIALGVGGAALGAALIVFLARPRPLPAPAPARLQILPTPGGAMATVGGSFSF